MEISGFLSVLDGTRYSVYPTISAKAMAGGVVKAATFRNFQGELLKRLQQAPDIEAVLLSLHGAMVAEDCDDTEGDTLRRVRDIVGPDIPIVVSLDPHANVTDTMLECADVLVAYRTFPHVDIYETGVRAARLLVDILEGRLKPVMEYVRVPVLVSPETQVDSWSPMKDIQDLCRSFEGVGGIRDVNYAAAQPWLDIPWTSHVILAVADENGREAAREAVRTIGRKLWEVREQFVPVRMAPRDAIARALKSDRLCFVMTEPYDAPPAGASGDSAALLKALLEMRAELKEPALVTVVDPEAVKAAFAAGVGNTVRTTVGFKLDPRWGEPVLVEGTVVRVEENARYLREQFGIYNYMGDTAVIQVDNVYVVVVEHTFMHLDPNSYRAVGLEPSRAKIVGVKSTIHFRHYYGPIASEIISLDGVGSSSGNFKTFDWKRISRPVWPLDEFDWTPEDGIAPKQ